MSPLALILIIVLVVLLMGGYGYRSGYYGAPQFGGILGVLLILLVILFLLGYLR